MYNYYINDIFFSKVFTNVSFSSPGLIGSRIDMVMFPTFLLKPCFGQTFPDFSAIGRPTYPTPIIANFI